MRETAINESRPLQWLLIGAAVAFLALFLVLPLAAVLVEAFRKGIEPLLASYTDEDTIAAVYLTLIVAATTVPLNLVFGVAAAWAIAKFEFRGKSLLISLIDLPFSVSPVVSGLTIFAVPGIVLATIFVTFPFIARELIPLMQEQGTAEEEAALTLGASGFRTFMTVTLPNVRWALLYGVLLCNARAMGEFGAVSVVSGHIRGLTNTMPLQVEILYNEYNFVGAFAVAALLAGLALVTLAAKSILEWRHAEGLSTGRRH